jgi:formylglycine-generating enzyme required for sulfatase activity
MTRRTSVVALAVATAGAAGLVLIVARGRAGTPAAWDDPVTGTRFLAVGPGRFQMGTPSNEHLREDQETLHVVVLRKRYYLAATEVTQAQWTRIMGDNPSHFADCGPSCPVERVTWFDVHRFVDRLNALGVRGYRLPTEAEWEFACRAGGRLAFGARDILSSYDANINGHYPYQAPTGPHRGHTTPVARFAANPFGFFDMSGNVWEWTEDEHCPYRTARAVDPIGSCGSEKRVIRGGSWAFDGGSARCGVRYTHRPQDTGYSIGVRLAHDVF